jgi:hypothetical protein
VRPVRSFSRALMAATAEASRRLHPIGRSYTEAQRFRRAEDRDLPTSPRKEQARCCIAKRDRDGRLPIGYCSPECERRPA